MGQLEEKGRKKSKKKNLQRLILATVGGAGVLAVGLLAPNVIGAMSKLGLLPNIRQKEYVSSSASKMVRKGLLKYNGKFYELTLLGQERMRRWELADFKFNKPKRWDERLQDSVWVYPYDCEDILTLLKTDLGVGKDVLYLIVEEMENDKYLREEFDLI